MQKAILFGLIALVAVMAGLLGAPEVAQAQGLVPCGAEGQPPCQLCHLFSLAHNIVEFILKVIVPIIAALLFAWGGFVWLTSSGSPARVKQGQQILFAAVVGMLIVYGAWLFINLLLTALGAATFTPGDWWEIDCSA